VKASDLVALLDEFARDKLSMRHRHVAVARHVTAYEINNTYQYIISREDVQLSWLREALSEYARRFPDLAEPEVRAAENDAAIRALITEDRDGCQQFVDRWSSRVEPITHARHRGMLRVILGETLEHKRFFDLALAGREDLLGPRPDGIGTGGGVLPVRWME
jgi:hypothetical protein